MEQNKKDEIDLIFVINGFKNGLKNAIVLLFNIVSFFKKTWYIFAGLIIFGVVLGYFSDSSGKDYTQSSSSLLRINFQAVDFIYGEIDLINTMLDQKDTLFIENLGLDIDSTNIIELKLSPLVNLKDVVDNYGGNSRYLEGLLKNVEIDEEYSDMFSSEFKYHNLNIVLSKNGTKEDIYKMISYLNSNPLLGEVRDQNVKEMNNRITDNDKIIVQLDQILETHNKDESFTASSTSNGVYIIDKNLNFDALIQRKIILQRENGRLNNLLIYSKEIVQSVNSTNLIKNLSVLNIKIIYYPILFVVLFLLFAFVRNGYLYLEEIVDNT